MKIDVFYLCRYADIDIINKTKIFLKSYTEKKTNIPHSLVIGLKGWDDDSPIKRLIREFNISCYCLQLKDVGFDWTSYFIFSGQSRSDYICFFNSHSVILSESWLELLVAGINNSHAALVGCTASQSEQFFIRAPSWHMIVAPWLLIYYFYNIIIKNKKIRLSASRTHIRSNAFLISRIVMCSFSKKKFCPISKSGAHELESGSNSLTNYVTECLGLKAIVIDRFGRHYVLTDGYFSATFRSGNQNGLIVSDNQTESFRKSNFFKKIVFTYITWGRF